MKTLSFRDLRVGRKAGEILIDIDSERDGISWKSGLQLVVAPNGYGKTSLFQTIAGALPALHGTLKLNDRTLKQGDDSTYISEYLTFPKFIYPMEWVEFMSGRAADHAALLPWIEGFALRPKLSSFLGRMSQGERRKVTWLGAHAAGKPLLLMDEPLDGLDLLAIRSARNMITQWRKEDRIVCIIAHQVNEVLDLADQVFLIRDRKLLPWAKGIGGDPRSLGQDAFREALVEFYSAIN